VWGDLKLPSGDRCGPKSSPVIAVALLTEHPELLYSEPTADLFFMVVVCRFDPTPSPSPLLTP
jgi:hypothetical protein